jgi:hypothetical protein
MFKLTTNNLLQRKYLHYDKENHPLKNAMKNQISIEFQVNNRLAMFPNLLEIKQTRQRPYALIASHCSNQKTNNFKDV